MHFSLPTAYGLILGIIAACAGLVMLIFPHILGYVAGCLMVAAGGIWIAGDAWFPGIISILLGSIVFIFRHFINYLVGGYLILLSLWFIFAAQSMVIGLITVTVGVSIMFFPDILAYLYGCYLLLAGFISLGNYFRWF